MRARPLVVSLAILLSLTFAACSGPGDDGGEDVEATGTSWPSPTTAPSPTAARTATPAATATRPASPTTQPTATATATPSPTPEPTATPSPTPEPTNTPTPVPELPAGGAEVRVLGKPIERLIAADPAGEILYAVTSAGLSRSHDGGQTWVASGSVPAGIVSVALDNPAVLIAGDEGACAAGGSDVPFAWSDDNGASWTQTGTLGFRPLLVEWSTLTVLGTDCRLQLTYDGGEEWIVVDGPANTDAYAAASTVNGLISDRLVILSIAEGGTSVAWLLDIQGSEPVDDGEIARFFGRGAVAAFGERIVLATATGVGVSDDRGETWRWSRDGLEDATYSVDPLEEDIPDDERGQPFGFAHALIDPGDPDRIVIGGPLGAYLSLDGGASWQRLGDRSPIDALAFSTDTQRIFVSANGGTRVWSDGGE